MTNIYVVEHTTEECIGNQVLRIGIFADSLEKAWDMADRLYAHLNIQQIYLCTPELEEQLFG